MASPKLSPEAKALLTEFLPAYAEDRARWPLWTYAREPAAFGEWSWRGAGSWPDRLRWSQRVPLLAILRDVISSVENAGGRLLAFAPHEPQASAARDGNIGFVQISPLHQARIAALFAATTHPAPPVSVDEIRIPAEWNLHQWLDDEDYDQLGQHLAGSVLHPPGRSLLSRFLQLAQQAGKKPEDRPGIDVSKEGNKLAEELVRGAGLLPERKGGKRLVLSVERVERLHSEGTEIVDDVRGWKPSKAQQRAVEKTVHAVTVIPIEEERRRHESEEQRNERIALEALKLRRPFLTPAELQLIMAASDTGSAARDLLRNRMTADIAPKTLQNVLAQARSS
jgi:hypothetical protein